MYNTDKKSLIREDKIRKNDLLRHNEYYDMQPLFDDLHLQSRQGNLFTNLYQYIVCDENILLSYRNIKKNKGSKTPGTNGRTIEYWENKPVEEFLKYMKNRMQNYIPQKVKRVEIPKSNGKMRPLGIPNIEDRLIQQCFKQVLEPICEAKFHPHSYGFRPNRSTEHAIAYLVKKINIDHSHFIVDIDIKGFFDNVSHKKLMRQIWTMGIRDKRIISIIKRMLKAEIDGIGIPDKGVPQGGILSPLLANIVLNELDWWISDQWQTFETKETYSQSNNKYRHLRKSDLKEMYVVRYADDFKIICKSNDHAKRVFIAVKQWLEERLKLQVSEEKSKITDVRKTCSEFLGFKIKATKGKKQKYIANSSIADKAKQSAIDTIKQQVKTIEKKPTKNQIYLLNKVIAGLQNYYKIATNVSQDFREINHNLSECLIKRLRFIRTKSGNKSREYLDRYGGYENKELYVLHEAIYPIYAVKTSYPIVFTQTINNYTREGRTTLHSRLGCIDKDILNFLTYHQNLEESVEFNDNRLSKYCAQQGKCIISKLPLDTNLKVHRILPRKMGGTDKYDNLILINPFIYDLIHSNIKIILVHALQMLRQKIDIKAFNKVNKYRKKIGNKIILENMFRWNAV